MKIVRKISKVNMEQSMVNEAKVAYSACSDDCPKCRVSDG